MKADTNGRAICGSAVARLLEIRVRTPQRAWMSVSCKCCVLSGGGLCDGPITRPTECGVSEWDSGLLRHGVCIYLVPITIIIVIFICRSQWLRDLRCGSAAARLLGSWVRIPPGSWVSVCCECCVLSGRGLCVGLITRPEETY